MEDTTSDSNSVTLMNFTMNEKGELVYMWEIPELPESTITHTADSTSITIITI